jgi:hypothetical protein
VPAPKPPLRPSYRTRERESYIGAADLAPPRAGVPWDRHPRSCARASVVDHVVARPPSPGISLKPCALDLIQVERKILALRVGWTWRVLRG